MNRRFIVQMPMFNFEDIGGPSSSPAPSDSGAPTGGAPTQPQNVGSPTSQAAPQAPATPVQTQQTEPSWLRGRLEETRATATRQAQAQWAQREAELRTQFENVQRQLHAIVGVSPQEDPAVGQIRTQFQTVFPKLHQLEQQAERLMQLAERAPQFDQQATHYWQSYAQQATSRLYDMAAKSIGAPLNDEGKRVLHQAFSGYVASSPEAAARYADDPTFIEEFWHQFENNFIGPSRRMQTAGVQQQAQQQVRLPQDGPSGAPVVSGGPRQFGSLEDRAAAAWTTFNQSRNQGF